LAEFVVELGKLFEAEKDVVSIESLYFADQGPHIVERGAETAGAGANAQTELVSHGDHLKQVADALDRATSDTQRALRVLPLTDTLSALARAGFGTFAQAVREALARGAAQRDPRGMAARLREAGTVLSGAPLDPDSRTQQLERIAVALRAAGSIPAPAAPAPRPGPTPAAAPTAARSAAPAAPTVASSRPSAPPGKTPPVAEDTPGLIGSLLRLRRYVEVAGAQPGSLDELMAGPPPLPTAAATSGPSAGEPVPIETICFAGPAALARALSLRDQVRAALTRGGSGTEVSELLEEIFDLVKLGQRGN
jgi:hypothetical protein